MMKLQQKAKEFTERASIQYLLKHGICREDLETLLVSFASDAIKYDATKLKLHNLQINPRDLPPESGDMPKDMKPVLAYTKELGWTTAIRRKHNRKYEWYCSNYYGNTVFLDKEIIMWAELPEV